MSDKPLEEDAMKRMAALVTHELRTPLTSVVGYLDLIIDRGDLLSDPERARAYLEVVRLRARAMVQTLNQLGDFGNPDAHQPLVDRSSSVANVLREITPELPVEVEDRDGAVDLVVDGRALHRALDELIGNAVKHGAASSVLVRTRLTPDARELCVEVINDGAAIDGEHSDHIFEPFWQQEQIETRTTNGLGLGLSRVRQLVESVGGSLALAEGFPTTFELRLPATATSVAALATRRAPDQVQAQALKAIADVRQLKATLEHERSLHPCLSDGGHVASMPR